MYSIHRDVYYGTMGDSLDERGIIPSRLQDSVHREREEEIRSMFRAIQNVRTRLQSDTD